MQRDVCGEVGIRESKIKMYTRIDDHPYSPVTVYNGYSNYSGDD